MDGCRKHIDYAKYKQPVTRDAIFVFHLYEAICQRQIHDRAEIGRCLGLGEGGGSEGGVAADQHRAPPREDGSPVRCQC